jgi:hypothetical protein
MQNITSIAELKNAIQLLEDEQSFKWQQLQGQFYVTFESLKPVNIIRNTLKDLTTPSNLNDDILGTAMGLASGYLSKKIFIGTSGNIFRKLFGSILQFGVTTLVSKHSDTIVSIGQSLIHHFLSKKEMNTKEP